MSVDLVLRAKGGDHEAFASLVRPHIDRLHGLAGLLLRDPSRAEDALQNALLNAWRDLPKLREPERFEAWLRRLVVNASHDEGRRLKRRRGETPLAPQHEPSTSGGIGADLADRDELARAFRRLKEEERQVVALRYYADLSSVEAAAALGIREVTYRSKLHRALRTLQAALAAEARGVTHATEGLLVSGDREQRDLERRLSHTLHAAAPRPDPHLAERLLGRTAATPQHRGWSPLMTGAGALAVAAVMVLAVLTGLALGQLPRNVGSGPDATESPSIVASQAPATISSTPDEPPPSPSPSAATLPDGQR